MMETNRFITSEGREIFSFPARAFPGLISNIYVISDGETKIMVDSGSGMDSSNQDLINGLQSLSDTFGQPFSLTDMDAIFITHGHIDHFGGLPFVRQQTDAPIAVHPLDRRVLTHYEERVLVASRLLETFLQRAGVPSENRQDLMAMYLFAKGIYRSTKVDILLEEGDSGAYGIEVYHVPGHCPGQVDHFLDSLDRIAALDGVRLGLGGHEDPMPDVAARIGEIKKVHEDRLNQVLEICAESKTTAEVSQELFGQVSSYHVLLALEEAGAHVEYLYQHGELVATNLDQIENETIPVIQYQRC